MHEKVGLNVLVTCSVGIWLYIRRKEPSQVGFDLFLFPKRNSIKSIWKSYTLEHFQRILCL